MKVPEYTEGPKALENFEKMAVAIFQKPKAGGRKTRKKSSKKASERKPENHDKD
jgi:hypothetical protein